MTKAERQDPQELRAESIRQYKQRQRDDRERKQARKKANAEKREQRKLLAVSQPIKAAPPAKGNAEKGTPAERHARAAIYHDFTLSGMRHLRDM
ncbi:TPA: hypothetical protein N2G37_004363 [Salmonella enterica]|nr:hypothetical protein [Salmonella enterica]